jgi:hypothetical protein
MGQTFQMIQPANIGRQFSGRTTLEEAARVRHERKPWERFSGSLFADYFRIADKAEPPVYAQNSSRA